MLRLRSGLLRATHVHHTRITSLTHWPLQPAAVALRYTVPVTWLHSTRRLQANSSSSDSSDTHAPLSDAAKAAVLKAEWQTEHDPTAGDADDAPKKRSRRKHRNASEDEVTVSYGSAGRAEEDAEEGPVWSGSSHAARKQAESSEYIKFMGQMTGENGRYRHLPNSIEHERDTNKLRFLSRRFVRRLNDEALEHVERAPLIRLSDTPLSMEVVMAPGDSKPRLPCRQSLQLNDAVHATVGHEAAARLLESMQNKPYPTLNSIARLAPALEDTIHVRGVLQIGDGLTAQERSRDDDAPMLRHEGAAAGAGAAAVAASSSGAYAASVPSSSSSAPASAPASSQPSALTPWSEGFATQHEHIVHPHLVDLSPLPGHGFVTSSRDQLLLRLAREQQCTLMASTSSTTRLLSHFIYALGDFHDIRTEGILLSDFDELPRRPTSAERAPAAVLLRKRREGEEVLKDVESLEQEATVRDSYSLASSTAPSGSVPLLDSVPPVWAVDNAPAWSNTANRILQELGHTLEAAFTHEPHEFAAKLMRPRNKAAVTTQVSRGKPEPGVTEEETSDEAQSTADSRPAIDEGGDSSSKAIPAADAPATAAADVRDAYLFIQMGNIMFRSQLDCWSPALTHRKELQSFLAPSDSGATSASSRARTSAVALPSWPGWELGGLVFDIKTRATLPIRLFCRKYSDLLDYHLLFKRGLLYSFEREYYDMQRAAFLKYSLQCRIGRMGGVLIGYHNTARCYAFHYVSVKEMDEALWGHTLMGEFLFNQATAMLNKHLAGGHGALEHEALLSVAEKEHAHNWKHRKQMAERDASAKKAAANTTGSVDAAAADKVSASAADEDLDDSPAPPLASLKLMITSQNAESNLLHLWLELPPLHERSQAPDDPSPLDPQANLPFLQRYTSQGFVDALPNYKIRAYLRELDLPTSGKRVEIVSRLEAALAPKPLEPLPPPSVFLALARANCIHKFVLRVQLSAKGETAIRMQRDASRDAQGQPIIATHDINGVIEQWVRDYTAVDQAAAEAAMSPEALRELQAERAAAAAIGEEVSSGAEERSPGSRGPPISADSLSRAPATQCSVSTSVTHLSVSNGRMSAEDLAADYRRVLEFNLQTGSDKADSADSDMVDALRLSMQDLVASQRRSANAEAAKAQERQRKARAKAQALRKESKENTAAAADADADADDDADVDAEEQKDNTQANMCKEEGGDSASGDVPSKVVSRRSVPSSSRRPQVEKGQQVAQSLAWKRLQAEWKIATQLVSKPKLAAKSSGAAVQASNDAASTPSQQAPSSAALS